MLLAAMLFAVPAFADTDVQNGQDGKPKTEQAAQGIIANTENNQQNGSTEAKANTNSTPATEDTSKEAPKTETPSWFSAKLGLITTAVAAVANWPVENVTTPVLSRIPYLKNNDAFKRNIPTVGKVILASALVCAVVKAYEAYNNAQDDSNDDEDVFGE